ncbi:MAG: hypothetical protein RLZ63_1345 [Pseudomonadota bacterium]|jgi:tetratricopeptide (TPR) repeat protein
MCFSISLTEPLGVNRLPMTIFFSPVQWQRAMLAIALANLLTFGLHAPAHADTYTDVQRMVRNQQWPQAQQAAQAHLKGHPNDPQMRLLLSQIQVGAGERAAAQATLQQLTQDYPELPEPHNNLAALYASQGRLDMALQSLNTAIAARPDYTVALENLGDVYLQLAQQAYAKAASSPAPSNKLNDKRSQLDALIKSAP